VTGDDPRRALDALDVFIGKWDMRASFVRGQDDGPAARTTFEWLPGRRFLMQRWEVDPPDAADGIAIIGLDADGATILQHYFDERGIARVYGMTFADGVWTLRRVAAAPDFSQRFRGTFATTGTRSAVSGTARRTARTGGPTSRSRTRGSARARPSRA
jgi:hypothetical protein